MRRSFLAVGSTAILAVAAVIAALTVPTVLAHADHGAALLHRLAELLRNGLNPRGGGRVGLEVEHAGQQLLDLLRGYVGHGSGLMHSRVHLAGAATHIRRASFRGRPALRHTHIHRVPYHAGRSLFFDIPGRGSHVEAA